MKSWEQFFSEIKKPMSQKKLEASIEYVNIHFVSFCSTCACIWVVLSSYKWAFSFAKFGKIFWIAWTHPPNFSEMFSFSSCCLQFLMSGISHRESLHVLPFHFRHPGTSCSLYCVRNRLWQRHEWESQSQGCGRWPNATVPGVATTVPVVKSAPLLLLLLS